MHGSCLCGSVSWQVEGPLELMTHCHCSRCRKHHGVAFATYVMAPADGFRFGRAGDLARYESSPGFQRAFCGRCGSVTPGEPWLGRMFVPAGSLDDDPGIRPAAHIFAASKASWYEIPDELPRFDAYPPGIDAPVLDDLPASSAGDAPRGSCLCGGVAYVVTGEPVRAMNCHCGRCRKARAAAHASNLFTALDGVEVTRGEDLLETYKVPDAQYFTHVFCRTCGSTMPRLDRERGIAIVPMGSLDVAPTLAPQGHIFVGAKAPWFEIADALPRHEAYPQSA